MASKNNITGDSISSKFSTGDAKKNYDDAYDRIFGRKKLGFNLESAFASLLWILSREDLNEEDMLKEVEKEIRWQQEYAKECGVI